MAKIIQDMETKHGKYGIWEFSYSGVATTNFRLGLNTVFLYYSKYMGYYLNETEDVCDTNLPLSSILLEIYFSLP